MSEAKEHMLVCNFIKSAYPKLIFGSDLSGLRLPKNLARLVKLIRSGNGFTDLFIYKPNKKYFALFIEMKDVGVKVFKKDGTLRKDDHLEEQAEMIRQLNELGYYAKFCIGHEEAIQTINDYMNNKL